jgi:hypothetical protein
MFENEPLGNLPKSKNAVTTVKLLLVFFIETEIDLYHKGYLFFKRALVAFSNITANFENIF